MPLEAVIRSVQEKKLNWQPGRTSVSDLDEKGKKAHLGLAVSEAQLARNRAATAAVSAAAALEGARIQAPGAIDWRNNGGNWITPVKDQQSCGSCVSFATCGTVEARARIICRNPNLDLNLSENQLFFCGCGNCCDTGWYFDAALNYAQATGIALDTDSPYTPVNKPCPPAQPRVRIRSWRAIYGTADRKTSLASKGPCVAGMAVYEDFYHYSGGVYRHATGPLLGYHAVVAVGYDDVAQCWICKNSWGTGFGEAGFFRIGYGDASGLDEQFPFYEVDLDCPDVSPATPCTDYVPLLQRVLVAAQASPALRGGLRSHVCGRGRRRTLTEAQMRVVRSTLLILRDCPQYKASFCAQLG